MRRLRRRGVKYIQDDEQNLLSQQVWANRLLPQWLGERHWKLAAVFTLMHGQTCTQTLQQIFYFLFNKKACCTGATGLSDMAAHSFGELDGNTPSLWFPDMSGACWRRGCAVYQDVWADPDWWNARVVAVGWRPFLIRRTFGRHGAPELLRPGQSMDTLHHALLGRSEEVGWLMEESTHRYVIWGDR